VVRSAVVVSLGLLAAQSEIARALHCTVEASDVPIFVTGVNPINRVQQLELLDYDRLARQGYCYSLLPLWFAAF
jgi:hypothetical protein